jgi:AraC family transcriptional regulator
LGGADTNSPLVDISPSEAVRRHIETWHGISAEFVQVTSEARIADHFRAPVHLLVVYEHGTRRCGESFVEGLPRSTLRIFARRFTLLPAGYEYREWQEPHTLSRLIFVYFDPANLPIDGHLGATEMAPLLFFEDTTLPGTALKPRAAVESPASDNHRHFSSALRCAHACARSSQSRDFLAENPRRAVDSTPRQQQIVTGYVQEHLGEQVSLATLDARARSLVATPTARAAGHQDSRANAAVSQAVRSPFVTRRSIRRTARL